MGTRFLGRASARMRRQRQKGAERRKASAPPPIAADPPPRLLCWDPNQSKYPPGFYTYRLIDPRSDLAFYVGKGQRDRAWQHERLVRLGKTTHNRRKDAAIQAVLDAGGTVQIDIVAIYEAEADALDHEYRLVDANPTLTNAVAGGGGSATTPAQLQLRNEVRARRLAEARARDREARRAAELERKREEMLALPGAERHADEISAWLSGAGRKEALRRFPSLR